MKLLSIAVPCYNSEAYMENCVRSLLVGGEEVEILIVDDGSSDGTGKIADRLESEHRGIVRAIHQPNKGHGGAVNTGLAHATGLYFKVVDSDDKVRASAYKSILDVLRRFSKNEQEEEDAAGAGADRDTEEALDLLISNYVYNKEGKNRHRVMEYRSCLPRDRVFSWEEAGRFPVGKYILMHSAIFRTQLLRDSGMLLPEHTFYVDNLYVFEPLPYVSRMYYLDVNFYYYFIGREDQSVNESVMIGRLDQQERVTRIMIDYYTDPSNQDRIRKHPRTAQYMFNYLEIITTITSVLSIRSGTPEHLALRDGIWDYIRQRDERLWKKMRRRPLGIAMNARGKLPRILVSLCYLLAQRIFSFN